MGTTSKPSATWLRASLVFEVPPSVLLLVLAVVSGLGITWAYFHAGVPPKPFRNRACQGRSWTRAFPSASKQETREFLSAFASSFAFRPGHKLKFAPTDRILAVYCAIYPRSFGADALELEALALEMERAFGVRLQALWSEQLTLGELFAACSQTRAELYR